MLKSFLSWRKFFDRYSSSMQHLTKDILTTKCVMSLRSPAEHEKQSFVMPAWIAGIQVRKDASGNVHVNLDSSTPCWNDVIEGFYLN
jgi:hypothetical protein